tara:strand:- start:756 stop:1364 length:609 start_codon:yes stop_codon:yes gene_type:complete
MEKLAYRLLNIVLATSLLFSFGGQVAIADPQSLEKENTVVRDHRIQKQTNEISPAQNKERENSGRVNVRDHRGYIPDTQELSSSECKDLGGVVSWFSGCKGPFGLGNYACFTHDQNGTTHGVCLSASASSIEKKPERQPSSLFASELTTTNSTTEPLTSQECTGLGGSVISTNSCNAKGHKACATVDRHGVIRVACINKVAK